MSDLAALISRLEAATGPDRELDCAIDDWLCASRLSWPIERARELRENNERRYGMENGRGDIAKFTSSLDAALTLFAGDIKGIEAIRADLERVGTPTRQRLILNLCIAALRARLSSQIEPMQEREE